MGLNDFPHGKDPSVPSDVVGAYLHVGDKVAFVKRNSLVIGEIEKITYRAMLRHPNSGYSRWTEVPPQQATVHTLTILPTAAPDCPYLVKEQTKWNPTINDYRPTGQGPRRVTLRNTNLVVKL